MSYTGAETKDQRELYAHRAVMMLAPASELENLEFASPWVAAVADDVLQRADVDDVKRLVVVKPYPVKDKESFLAFCELVWNAHIDNCKRKGIDLE